MPSASVNANSCTAVAPASRMWYPEIDTGLNFGTCRAVNSIMSVTMRTAGSGGQIHSFWAMNSLSMSFCMVPPSRLHATPCLSAMARYMARATDAVQLIVIDVVERRDRHAFLADLPPRARMVGVVAHQRRHVEGGGEPGLPLREEVLEA